MIDYIAYCKKEHGLHKEGTFHYVRNDTDEDGTITCFTDVEYDWKHRIITNRLYYRDWQHFCQYWDVRM